MSKISEQNALEEYPLPKEEPYSISFINKETFNSVKRTGYIVGYEQAMQDIFDYIEAHIPCGEMSNGIVLDVIQECKLYFEGEV